MNKHEIAAMVTGGRRIFNMLAMPLLNTQIEAAVKFWEDGGWETKEIPQLKQVFPNLQDAVKLKAVVLSALDGTNIIAIARVGDCLDKMLNANYSTGPAFVEEMVAEMRAVTGRNNYSFAAKFAHFFVNSDLPILDKYAEFMVVKHLGAAQSKNPKRYLKFAEDIEKLKDLASLTCDCLQLDAYLWVAGDYWRWKRNSKENINTDLKRHFERLEQNLEAERTLGNLLGL